MPWKIVRQFPSGTVIREFVGKATPEEEADFYSKFSRVKVAPLPRQIGRLRKGQKSEKEYFDEKPKTHS